MRRATAWIATTLLGLAIGSASALWATGLWPGTAALAFSDVNVGGWRSDWAIGEPAANPYLRARVARQGLLALVKTEAVYFTRTVDGGGQQPSAWWSVTLYNAASRLPMNRDDAIPIDATKTADAARWSATIAPERPADGLWLSSRNAGRFDLTLRLYRPAAAALARPAATIQPPRVKRLSYAGADT